MPVLAPALILSFALLPGTAPAQPASSLANMLTADMTTPHEARPHGVPRSYDWAKRPRPRETPAPAGFDAITAWGQLYRCAGAGFDPRETIELRDLQTWLLVHGRWRRAQRSSALDGDAFPEDYVGAPAPPRVRSRSARGTTVSLTRGHNFHFWPGRGRAAIDPRAVDAVAVVVRARRTSPRRAACVTLSVGADYWRSVSAPGGSGNVTDAGIGRFKRVEWRWRAFGMTSASARTLARHPLPLRLPQGELR